MARVEFRNIRKQFEDSSKGVVTAVDDSSFVIEDQEFVVFVGPSGCGKTTSLRIIAGLEKQTSGEVFIGERNVSQLHPKDRDIAMVFQDYALYPHMTVKENLSFGLKNLKKPKDEIERKVKDASEILGLHDMLDRKPRELSGGQRQRVAVGRAIVRDPQVFLFDEPLSNLDAKLRVQMRVELSELHKRLGATIVYVTHDQVEAMTLGERIVVMNNGKIQQIASPTELYAKPKNMFVAGFIGSPPMNFIDGQFEGGHVHFPGGSFPVLDSLAQALGQYEGKPIIIGLRPEHIGSVQIPKESDAHRISFQSVVHVIEHLGAENLLYFRVGDRMITARVDPEAVIQVGQMQTFTVERNKLHFFDPETEQRIDI